MTSTTNTHETKIDDIIIIGSGPTGLFAAFYAGMREMKTTIIEAHAELGGQLTVLYPEKYIYDMPGFPKILAKNLVKELVEQAYALKRKVALLGGEEKQFEMDL